MASSGLHIPYSMDDVETSTARASLEKMICTATMEPIMLPLSLLRQITKDFSHDQQIGRGGFATVYKGLLQNGTVAVKLSNNAVLDDKSFQREVNCLMTVKHKNIVRFLGYCVDSKGELQPFEGGHVIAEKQRRLLCFEYLSQGSLRKHICDASGGLEWRARYHIIRGICEGLEYLHQKEIVHSDLKPENILLDEYRVPKIADFGLSICFGNNQSPVTTEGQLVGTLGYMAPEFIDGTIDDITCKSDIYSLGVIIIEILTGRKGCPEIEHVLDNWKTRIETSSLGETAWLEQVRLCAEIGKECINYNAKERPDTRQIIERLKKMETKIGFIKPDICTLATQVDSLGLSETLMNLLDAQPLELRFPLEQNKSIECPASLTNRSDRYVGAWITPTDHTSFPLLLDQKPLRGPVFQMIEPRSTLAVGITMEKKQRKLPAEISIMVRKKKSPSETKRSTLEVVMAVMESKDRVETLKSFIDSMPHVNKYLLRIVDVLMVAMDSTDCLKKLKSYFSWRNWKELLQTVEEKMVAIGNKERVDSLRLYVCKMLNIQSDDVLERMEQLGGRVYRETLTVATYDPATSSQPLAAGAHMADPKFMSTLIFKDVTGIDVHPTETWILVAHEGDCVSIWNYETQQQTHEMVLHVSKADGTRVSVRSAKFIAQEHWIVVGDADGWVHVYAYASNATKAKVAEFEAHGGFPVSLLVVQPMDSFLLTSSSAAGTPTKLWYWGQGWKCTREFDDNSSGVSHLTFNPRDTSIFASVSTTGDVKVWDSCITHPIATLERSIGSCFFYTDDTCRHFLVTTTREDNSWAVILDLKTLEAVHQIGVRNQCLFDAACHPKLPLLVTITRDKGIYLWDLKTYRVEKIAELTDLPLRGTMFTGTDFPRLIIPSRKGLSIVELNQFAAPKLGQKSSEQQLGIIHTSSF